MFFQAGTHQEIVRSKWQIRLRKIQEKRCIEKCKVKAIRKNPLEMSEIQNLFVNQFFMKPKTNKPKLKAI